MVYIPPLIKQPWEDKTYDFLFGDIMPTGRTVASIVEVVQQKSAAEDGPWSGESPSGELTLAPGAVGGKVAQVKIGAGVDGYYYKVACRVLDNAGDRHEADGVWWVKNL
jgi:hypothetical protein